MQQCKTIAAADAATAPARHSHATKTLQRRGLRMRCSGSAQKHGMMRVDQQKDAFDGMLHDERGFTSA